MGNGERVVEYERDVLKNEIFFIKLLEIFENY